MKKVAVICPSLKKDRDDCDAIEYQKNESIGLAQSINLNVALVKTIVIAQPRPSTFLGVGFIKDLKLELESLDISLVYIDKPISAIQQRNLERELNVKVIDRTGLILEIFGARAQTSEGCLQVELAALTYQKSRLVRSWTHLERQKGGFGFLGGPGESQIELDRRMISYRIQKLQKSLEKVKKTRLLHRQSRQKIPYPVVALTGYTNAGKSSLFNKLTGANAFSQDLLFATLDPMMRLVTLPSGKKVMFSDTVGFISNLPTHLILAFRATLEEVIQADVVVHVRDITNSMLDEQAKVVHTVLKDLGLEFPHDSKHYIEAFNKVDMIDHRTLCNIIPHSLKTYCLTSAVTGQGLDTLVSLIDQCLSDHARYLFQIPSWEGRIIAWLHEYAQIVSKEICEGSVVLDVYLDKKSSHHHQGMIYQLMSSYQIRKRV